MPVFMSNYRAFLAVSRSTFIGCDHFSRDFSGDWDTRSKPLQALPKRFNARCMNSKHSIIVYQ